MLNYIWLGIMVLAVVIGAWTDKLKEVADASFTMAGKSVMDIALPLVGIMALWLGIMRLAERSGLVTILARALRPIMRWLFPDVPAEHPAMGSMLMNMAANMLGLGNAATPLGLRAMEDLNQLNPYPGTATNAMCMFLAMNTSSMQLIPVTALAILAANHSNNPTAIVGTSIMATACGTMAAIAAAKILSRLPMYRLAPVARPVQKTDDSVAAKEAASAADAKSPVKEAATLQPLRWWGVGILCLFAALCISVFVLMVCPGPFGLNLSAEAARQSVFIRIVDSVSKLSVPVILSVFPLYAALRRVKVYEEFVEGAKEGFDVAIRIIPYLVAILVAIGMFRAAGGIDMLSNALTPLMKLVKFPSELLPMVLMRPLSGSGTLGVFAELVEHFGPDSLIARTAGTIYGSTETTFYVLAVYFGAVAVKKTRYALLAGLIADFVGIVASVVICKRVFG